MQAMNARVQKVGTGARPASGSALLAGHVVTLTVPILTMVDELLAIGDEWTELCLSKDTEAGRSFSETRRLAVMGDG